MTKDEILVDLYKKLTSRKFMVVVAVAALLLMDNFGWLPLEIEIKNKLITLALGYIFVEGGVDGVRAIQAAKGGSI